MFNEEDHILTTDDIKKLLEDQEPILKPIDTSSSSCPNCASDSVIKTPNPDKPFNKKGLINSVNKCLNCGAVFTDGSILIA